MMQFYQPPFSVIHFNCKKRIIGGTTHKHYAWNLTNTMTLDKSVDRRGKH